MTAHSHLAVQALALHLLLERAQRLIDVVVANLDFHRQFSPSWLWPNTKSAKPRLELTDRFV